MSAKPREGVCGASGVGDTGLSCEEVNVIISDLHIGEGQKVRVEYGGRRGVSRACQAVLRTLRLRKEKEQEIDNPLEGFHFDNEFSDLLDLFAERFSSVEVLRLRLLGDILDPLCVTLNGRYDVAKHEHEGAEKMRAIIAGHPMFFDTLKRFLERSNCLLDMFVGNHDLFLVWDSVREMILERITGGDADLAAKVRFIGGEDSFCLVERDVLYGHGMEVEPHNYIDPKNVIVREVVGMKLQKPILNTPLGSYLFVYLAIPLKLHNHLLGNLREDSDVWAHALRCNWPWGGFAFVMQVWLLAYVSFFAFWDFRRKASFRQILDIVVATATVHRFDKYIERLFRENEGVRVVVQGHTHKFKRESGKRGTHINPGTWTTAYRMYEPEFERKWVRLERLEPYWRTLCHFFHTGKVKFAARMTRFIGVLSVIGILATFVIGGFWPVDTLQIKFLTGIVTAFIVLASLFRLLSAEPVIVDDTRMTFGLIRHYTDGSMDADLMEYLPDKKDFRECV
jgi:UDP-2,3-diacylglucosamine pyrophosphatase LpxH